MVPQEQTSKAFHGPDQLVLQLGHRLRQAICHVPTTNASDIVLPGTGKELHTAAERGCGCLNAVHYS